MIPSWKLGRTQGGKSVESPLDVQGLAHRISGPRGPKDCLGVAQLAQRDRQEALVPGFRSSDRGCSAVLGRAGDVTGQPRVHTEGRVRLGGQRRITRTLRQRPLRELDRPAQIVAHSVGEEEQHGCPLRAGGRLVRELLQEGSRRRRVAGSDAVLGLDPQTTASTVGVRRRRQRGRALGKERSQRRGTAPRRQRRAGLQVAGNGRIGPGRCERPVTRAIDRVWNEVGEAPVGVSSFAGQRRLVGRRGHQRMAGADTIPVELQRPGLDRRADTGRRAQGRLQQLCAHRTGGRHHHESPPGFGRQLADTLADGVGEARGHDERDLARPSSVRERGAHDLEGVERVAMGHAVELDKARP